MEDWKVHKKSREKTAEGKKEGGGGRERRGGEAEGRKIPARASKQPGRRVKKKHDQVSLNVEKVFSNRHPNVRKITGLSHLHQPSLNPPPQ